MKRQELWERQYRQRRYLEHATPDELSQRFQDLLHNTANYNAEGQFAMKIPGEGGPWIEFFTHVLEELRLRGKGLDPMMLKGGHFDPKRYVSCKRAAEVWKGHDRQPNTYLVKFSKLKYLRPFFNVGSLRIAPASYYRDPSLNFSIRDSELEFTQELHGARVHCPPNQDVRLPMDQWIEVPIIGGVKSTVRSESDYYIACFSASYEYRLYDDFEADGCLVITDIGRFAASLQSRMEEVLPGWRFNFGRVEYRDPYHPSKSLDLFFCKHFRYSYQEEIRFVWIPPTKNETLKPVHLELGPLVDYCELLYL